jgi:hypothetical protein
MLSVVNAECHLHCEPCFYYYVGAVMLNVIMLIAIMLNVIMLNAVMLNVNMLNVNMLNVIILSVVTPNVASPLSLFRRRKKIFKFSHRSKFFWKPVFCF